MRAWSKTNGLDKDGFTAICAPARRFTGLTNSKALTLNLQCAAIILGELSYILLWLFQIQMKKKTFQFKMRKANTHIQGCKNSTPHP